MPQVVSIPTTEKLVRKPRSPKPQARKAKSELRAAEEQRTDAAETHATTSRILRPSYRPGGFGDPL